MIDKDQVQILQFRDEILDGQHLEEKYKKKLPPIFRSFITVFEPSLGFDAIYRKEYDTDVYFTKLIYSQVVKESYDEDDDEIDLISFKEVEDILRFDRNPDDWEGDVLDISEHGSGDRLLVGISKHNQDFIYMSYDMSQYRKLANNIFELIHKMIAIIDYNIVTESEKNKLYRNFGDKIWLLKD